MLLEAVRRFVWRKLNESQRKLIFYCEINCLQTSKYYVFMYKSTFLCNSLDSYRF